MESQAEYLYYQIARARANELGFDILAGMSSFHLQKHLSPVTIGGFGSIKDVTFFLDGYVMGKKEAANEVQPHSWE